LGLIAEGLR